MVILSARKSKRTHKDTNPTQITVSSVQVPENPDMKNVEKMDHFLVILTNPKNNHKMQVYFSQGFGHREKTMMGDIYPVLPTADDVLHCLISDSDCMDYDFEEWASNLGYDPDSRKAEKTFNVCKRQTEKLIKFIDSKEDMEALREWSSEY